MRTNKMLAGQAAALAIRIINGGEFPRIGDEIQLRWREQPSAYIGRDYDEFQGLVRITAELCTALEAELAGLRAGA